MSACDLKTHRVDATHRRNKIIKNNPNSFLYFRRHIKRVRITYANLISVAVGRALIHGDV